MSGILIVAFAGLLTQQAAPHPSTQTLYEAPAIRPFEPGSDFGREVAEGDGEAGATRRALTAPVTVDAYARSYEASPTDAEIAYEQGVASAEIRTDQTAGPLDGVWVVRDGAGQALYEVLLMDSGPAAAVEGGWSHAGRSGVATAGDGVLTLEGVGSIALERSGEGWRGQMNRDGRRQPVTLTRPD